MWFTVHILIALIGITVYVESKLQWNIAKPYKYKGFIYTDSHTVVINPSIQIRLDNNEEICNFYVNASSSTDERLPPFRAVVKSAHLGIGELELKPNVSLNSRRNQEITFFVVAEACHDPDSWSDPASVFIQVLDPPGPLWTKKSYSVTIKSNAPSGTTLLKVSAYVPKWTNVENKICQYSIKSPRESPFQIDGEGMIRTTERLIGTDKQYWTLIVVAQDCSQPMHRESHVNVFISVNPSCKFGWRGFYTLMNYMSGSGVKYISKNPGFELCDSKMDTENSRETVDTTIADCMTNKTLRLTTSVELKYMATVLSDAELSDQSNCKLDYQSLRLQREVCGISGSHSLDLITELNRQRTGVLLFPMQANIFPAVSIYSDNKFSFYFWMKRDRWMGSTEEFIVCQIDEAGDNIFSITLRKCVLRIQLKSYKSTPDSREDSQNIPTVWVFTLPQLCDNKWHHIGLHASRSSENLASSELRMLIDGEITEFKNDNPEVFLHSRLDRTLSNMTDIFLGQCPKSVKTEFKGMLAGVVMTPGIVMQTSTSRCLTKCSERLYFNGMNQMNPGMSVSLNSEMQMIIINGHSIAEVIRLVKLIGFVNPTSNPTPGERELSVDTEMSCGTRLFNVAPVKIVLKIQSQTLKLAETDTLTLFNLRSTATTIIVPDSTQTNSDMGTGVAVFANTSMEMSGSPQSTNPSSYMESWTISKCMITMRPRLNRGDYLDWPRHLLEAVSAEKYSIKVTNTSRTLVFHGLHNQQVYQFVIQHLRYFSSMTDDSSSQATRIFKLQCFSRAGKSVVKSNVAVVKVIIWFNNYQDKQEVTSTPSTTEDSTTEFSGLWKDLINNMTIVKHYVPLHAQSNAALISEIDASPKRSTNILYNILLGIGLMTLVSAILMLIKKIRRNHTADGCLVPYQVVDRICFPLQLIKEKIRPSPSVRVELSRDFINCISERRRDISMEMQWDDTELKTNNGFNIIANPMYEASVDTIDDINLNKNVPPTCEEEDSTTDCDDNDDDDTYGDFTELYLERNKHKEKVK